jgi:hypothetical protein
MTTRVFEVRDNWYLVRKQQNGTVTHSTADRIMVGSFRLSALTSDHRFTMFCYIVFSAVFPGTYLDSPVFLAFEEQMKSQWGNASWGISADDVVLFKEHFFQGKPGFPHSN